MFIVLYCTSVVRVVTIVRTGTAAAVVVHGYDGDEKREQYSDRLVEVVRMDA